MGGRRNTGVWGASFLFSGGVLFLLLAASPTEAPRADEKNPRSSFPADPSLLPWYPLTQTLPELERVSMILRQPGVARDAKTELLSALADNLDEPPLVRGLASFGAGYLLLESKQVREASERLLAPTLGATSLEAYALYLVGRELEETGPDTARAALARLVAEHPGFPLVNPARVRLARLLVRSEQKEDAVALLRPVAYEGAGQLRGEAMLELADVLASLGELAEAASLLESLYYEMPTNRHSRDAASRLSRLRAKLPGKSAEDFYRLSFRRAERLFEAKEYREADRAYLELLRRFPAQAERDLINLRRGVCQYRRRQSSSAEKTLANVDRPDLKPEALYYRAESLRRLRREVAYFETLDEIVRLAPKSPWAEEALWSRAQYHRARDENGAALDFYRRVVSEFPHGKYFLRAQWFVLWEQYRRGDLAETAQELERAAREHPGGDELSQFLYWAGRGYEAIEQPERAAAIYRQVLLGFRNTYYGRRAAEALERVHGQGSLLAAASLDRRGVDLGEGLELADRARVERMRELLALELYEQALLEAEAGAERDADGPAFRATKAWIHSLQGHHRDAIITMRRAFPFHSSATGDLLPRGVWEVLYPLEYWDHLVLYARERELDPFLVAGLIRQESTFNPVVRSPAGARGLMQIMPRTGRILARHERRRYSLGELTDPEINIRYGTRYLRQVLDRFEGRLDYALASYNAGPHRVRRWAHMDRTREPEAFIEEIPFTETRNYVKLVLRNEMMYRRIYGELAPTVAD